MSKDLQVACLCDAIEKISTSTRSEAMTLQAIHIGRIAGCMMDRIYRTVRFEQYPWRRILNRLAFKLQHAIPESLDMTIADKTQDIIREWTAACLKDVEVYNSQSGGLTDHTTTVWIEEEAPFSDYYVSTIIRLYLPKETSRRVHRLLTMSPEDRLAAEQAGEENGREPLGRGGKSNINTSGIAGPSGDNGNHHSVAVETGSKREADKTQPPAATELSKMAPDSAKYIYREDGTSMKGDARDGDELVAQSQAGEMQVPDDGADIGRDSNMIEGLKFDGDAGVLTWGPSQIVSSRKVLEISPIARAAPRDDEADDKEPFVEQREGSLQIVGDAGESTDAGKPSVGKTDRKGVTQSPEKATAEAEAVTRDLCPEDVPLAGAGATLQDYHTVEPAPGEPQAPAGRAAKDGTDTYEHTLGVVESESVPSLILRSPEIGVGGGFVTVERGKDDEDRAKERTDGTADS